MIYFVLLFLDILHAEVRLENISEKLVITEDKQIYSKINIKNLQFVEIKTKGKIV